MEQYIADLKAGDIEKFSYIVHQYERQIFIYCSRILNSEQDAEDAIQEIFFKAYKSIDSYKPNIVLTPGCTRLLITTVLIFSEKEKYMRRLSLCFLWRSEAKQIRMFMSEVFLVLHLKKYFSVSVMRSGVYLFFMYFTKKPIKKYRRSQEPAQKLSEKESAEQR